MFWFDVLSMVWDFGIILSRWMVRIFLMLLMLSILFLVMCFGL